MTDGKQNFKIQLIITVIGVVLFAVKIIAWHMTHSVSILTDALESTINVVAGFVGLYSIYYANQPKDINHPYGHGKAEFLSAGIEGTMICLAGLGIIYQAAVNLIHPPVIHKIDIGIILVSFTAIVNYAMGWTAAKIGAKNNSAALIASGRHLQTDTYSTIGIVIGLALMLMTGLQWIDSISALFFGGVVLVTSMRILRGSVAGMMDEADHGLIKEIVTFINDHHRQNWIDLHNLRIIKYGSVLHIDMHVTMPWYLDIREAHMEQEILAQLLRQKYGGAKVEIFAHIDACQPFSCRLCMKENCHVRQHSFEKKVVWTAQNVQQNHKHRLETTESHQRAVL